MNVLSCKVPKNVTIVYCLKHIEVIFPHVKISVDIDLFLMFPNGCCKFGHPGQNSFKADWESEHQAFWVI